MVKNALLLRLTLLQLGSRECAILLASTRSEGSASSQRVVQIRIHCADVFALSKEIYCKLCSSLWASESIGNFKRICRLYTHSVPVTTGRAACRASTCAGKRELSSRDWLMLALSNLAPACANCWAWPPRGSGRTSQPDLFDDLIERIRAATQSLIELGI